jgi:predicted DNA-binding transcriptional regulator AlpA
MSRLLRYRQLRSEKGIDHSRMQLRRKIEAGTFPAPVTLDDRNLRPAIAWLEVEVDQWIAERTAKRAVPPPTSGYLIRRAAAERQKAEQPETAAAE